MKTAVNKRISLILYGLNNFWMAVPHIVYANPASEQLTGIKAENCMSKFMHELVDKANMVERPNLPHGSYSTINGMRLINLP